MQFGKVQHPENINFTLPEDHIDTQRVLGTGNKSDISIYVGCAKWNKQDLKGFYPRGTKDELHYYSRQYNSIELNATFYRMYDENQFHRWYDKTPIGFKFFPKLVQDISHLNRLGNDADPYIDQYLRNVVHLKEKLGTIFLQLHGDFDPSNFERVSRFIERWPENIPLAIEFRHTDWFNDIEVAEALYTLLEAHNVANIITDTAGRRDLLHMRLTNKEAFVRYVGANHVTDYNRLDDWVIRLKSWKDQGIENIHFFIHQNIEKESPLLSKYFIESVNQYLDFNLQLPGSSADSPTLFG